MSETKETNLFEEFPPITTEEWEKAIEKDLKGADYERKLVWKTYEGFKLRPYYRREDLKNLSHLGSLPGEAPYLRGNNKNNNSWFLRQNIDVEDVVAANEKALDVLMKGITSLGFNVEGKVLSDEDLKKLLNDIALESIELNFISGKSSLEILNLLKNKFADEESKKKELIGSLDYDPIGNLTLRGVFYEKDKDPFDGVAELVEKSKDFPNLRVIGIHGDYFKNAGSGIVQELAFSLAAASEYLEKTSDKGVDLEDILRKIKFNLAIGNVYFMEIAKLRALRFLWSKLQEAFGIEKPHKINVYSVTGRWNKTFYDPYVNMLRTTTEGMSAAIGGTDSMTIEPFNATFEKPTEFSERIARNQQNLLNEESYFSKIADPAGGSYYIESITAKFIEHTWNLFLEIQEKGGYIEAFKAGFIQEKIKETASKKDKMVAQRRENLLGVNQFPNFTEHVEEEIDESILKPTDLTDENAIAETLKLYRGAQVIEALRYDTDKYAMKNPRPRAQMLTIGNLTMRKARSLFSCNFFACAGFDVIDNNGFETVKEGIEEARKQKARIIVLCSSDNEYATLAPDAFKLINDDEMLVVAGAPACTEELKAQGINNFVNVKSNLVETLRYYQKELSVI